MPSALKAFIQADLSLPSSMRTVVCSGEALSRSVIHNFSQRFVCGLLNLYGPTEATVDVSFWEAKKDTLPLIGYPIDNTSLHVLMPSLQVAPILATGELFIGGVGLAEGYLNRPELTKEKFVQVSIGGKPPIRLYRSGDLARRRPDGGIEYLGRIDQQIKVKLLPLFSAFNLLPQHSILFSSPLLPRSSI